MSPNRPALSVVKIDENPTCNTLDQIRSLIRELRINGCRQKLKVFEINEKISNLILEYLNRNGQFYSSDMGLLFYIAESTGKAIQVSRSSKDLKLILSDFALNPTEKIMDYVIEVMIKFASEKGIPASTHSLSHYDSKKNRLYLNFTAKNIYLISEEDNETRINGSDGILFLDEPITKDYEKTQTVIDSSLLKVTLLNTLNLDATTDEYSSACKAVILVFFWSLFFPELLPTRPILTIIGEKGSGKSTLLKLIGRIIYGKDFNVIPMPTKQDDYETAVTNRQFAAFDNADSYRKWLPDALATTATGGHLVKRELYTTNDLVSYPIRAFIAVTAKDPRFMRDDVADRSLIINLRRFEKFRGETKLFSQIEKSRNAILTEMMKTIQKILTELKNTENQDFTSNSRMADFAEFAQRIAPAINYSREEMGRYISLLCDEQQNILALNDPLLEIIDDCIINRETEDLAIEHTTNELHNLFRRHSDQSGLDYHCKSTKSLGHKLGALRQVLKSRYDLEERIGSSRQHYWKIASKSSNSCES